MPSPSSARWDAVVAGAGPAGSLAAGLLARAGARVLIVDRARWPRDKVCGGCLSPLGAACLQRHRIPPAPSVPVPVMELVVANQRCHLPTPGFRAIRRRDLDDSLLDWAVAGGAEARLGERASFLGPRVVQLGGGERLDAELCIAADGLSGTSLAHDPRFAWDVRPAPRVGLGAVVEAAWVPGVHGLSMFVADAGYVGLAPLPGGLVDIAAAIDPGSLRQGPGEVLARIVTDAGGQAGNLASIATRGVPALWRRRRCVEAPGLFAVGDACGYVEPFTGEGLTWALLGAESLVPLALQALEGRYQAGAWAQTHARMSRRPRVACGLVALLLRRPDALGALASLTESCPALGKLAAWSHGALGGVAAPT